MTAVGLIKAVSEHVRGGVANYRLEKDGGGQKPVTVYEQLIPEEVFENDDAAEYHPLIGVTLTTLEDDDERSEATLDLTFAVYSEDADGWLDLMNLIETVRLALLKKKMLARRYRLVLPLTVELIERQPRPFFYGLMTAKYLIHQPEEERVHMNGGISTWDLRK